MVAPRCVSAPSSSEVSAPMTATECVKVLVRVRPLSEAEAGRGEEAYVRAYAAEGAAAARRVVDEGRGETHTDPHSSLPITPVLLGL